MKRYKTADDFFADQPQWEKELAELRSIVGETELKETVKWGFPVYTLGGKNVVGIGSFKSYFGIWFFQGAFLKDKAGVLVNAQQGRTKGMRQWRMNSGKEIKKKLILEYVAEAIDNQRAGKQIKPERKSLVIPPELKTALTSDRGLKSSFESLTKGRQREYADYISEAKREATKLSRLEKITPMIKSGQGLNDKYK